MLRPPVRALRSMRWPSPSKRSSRPWWTSPSRARRSPRPVSASRSTLPCSSTPARTRCSTYSRLRSSSTTDSMPSRCRRCDSISPAGPAPTLPTCVRIRLTLCLVGSRPQYREPGSQGAPRIPRGATRAKRNWIYVFASASGALPDAALAQPNRLLGRRPRDEVRPGGEHLRLRREEPVAGELRQHHHRQVALEVGLLVDRERDAPARHGPQDLGREVERAERYAPGAAAPAQRGEHRGGAVAAEGERAVDRAIAQRGGQLPFRHARVADVDRDHARGAADRAHRLREPPAACVGARVADLVVDAQDRARAGVRQPEARGLARRPLLLADVRENAE